MNYWYYGYDNCGINYSENQGVTYYSGSYIYLSSTSGTDYGSYYVTTSRCLSDRTSSCISEAFWGTISIACQASYIYSNHNLSSMQILLQQTATQSITGVTHQYDGLWGGNDPCTIGYTTTNGSP